MRSRGINVLLPSINKIKDSSDGFHQDVNLYDKCTGWTTKLDLIAGVDEFILQWINPGRVSELQTSVYVVVTEDSTDDLSSVNFPSFLNTDTPWDSQIHGKYKSQDSMPYAVVLKSRCGQHCSTIYQQDQSQYDFQQVFLDVNLVFGVSFTSTSEMVTIK
ncbi:uncharacterized protein [Dysidea avara]|uniref:uncharacterized protein isoform X2 n=1 Tax=Dysidea avara TaxID=196820 RepID=UPI003322F129